VLRLVRFSVCSACIHHCPYKIRYEMCLVVLQLLELDSDGLLLTAGLSFECLHLLKLSGQEATFIHRNRK
jgi:hypothetical protein